MPGPGFDIQETAPENIKQKDEKENNINNDNNGDMQTQKATYLLVKDENGASMELDLVTARERGEEIRYLGISLGGKNVKTNEEQNAFIHVDEGGFSLMKDFFEQLNWRD